MKKILLFAILIVALFSFNSCYRDTTNYDYVDINEITIDTIGFTDTIYRPTPFVTVLEIDPIIHATQIVDVDNYKYEWILSTTTASDPLIRNIGTERNLSFLVDLPIGTHTLTFRVTDKTTGLREYIQTTISIETGIERGCLVLCEDAEGYTQLDMIVMGYADTIIAKNITKANGVPKLKGPKYITWTSYSSKFWMTNVVQMSTEDGTYLLDPDTYGPAILPRFEDIFFYDASVTDKYVLQDCISYLKTYRHVIMDGNYFSTLSSMDKYMLGPAANRYADSYDLFKVGDKIAYNTSKKSIGGSMPVLYNKDESRFVVANGSATSPAGNCSNALETSGTVTAFKFDTKLDFPPNGLEYVTTINSANPRESSTHNASFTILKNPANQRHYMYSYCCLKGSPIKIGLYEITDAPDIKNATLFAHSNYGSKLFYTVGAKLYGYDYITKNSQILKDYNLIYPGSNNTITTLFYEIISPGTPGALTVATDTFYIAMYDSNKPNDTCGRVIKYENLINPNKVEIEEIENCNWDGLGKPVSLCIKTN